MSTASGAKTLMVILAVSVELLMVSSTVVATAKSSSLLLGAKDKTKFPVAVSFWASLLKCALKWVSPVPLAAKLKL